MKGLTAVYLGRIVDKDHFRAFVYNAQGQDKCVDSWEEFEAHMESGLWFATYEESIRTLPIKNGFDAQKLNTKPNTKLNKAQKEPSINMLNDDFLPEEPR